MGTEAEERREALQQLGIEVLRPEALAGWIEVNVGELDSAILAGVANAERWLPDLLTRSSAKILFVSDGAGAEADWRERGVWRCADLVLHPTEQDRQAPSCLNRLWNRAVFRRSAGQGSSPAREQHRDRALPAERGGTGQAAFAQGLAGVEVFQRGSQSTGDRVDIFWLDEQRGVAGGSRPRRWSRRREPGPRRPSPRSPAGQSLHRGSGRRITSSARRGRRVARRAGDRAAAGDQRATQPAPARHPAPRHNLDRQRWQAWWRWRSRSGSKACAASRRSKFLRGSRVETDRTKPPGRARARPASPRHQPAVAAGTWRRVRAGPRRCALARCRAARHLAGGERRDRYEPRGLGDARGQASLDPVDTGAWVEHAGHPPGEIVDGDHGGPAERAGNQVGLVVDNGAGHPRRLAIHAASHPGGADDLGSRNPAQPITQTGCTCAACRSGGLVEQIGTERLAAGEQAQAGHLVVATQRAGDLPGHATDAGAGAEQAVRPEQDGQRHRQGTTSFAIHTYSGI